MENTNKLKIIFVILIALSLIIFGSYALVNFILEGNNENVITTNNISINYAEAETGINVTNAIAMTDEEGKANGYETTLQVTGTSNQATNIVYNIYLKVEQSIGEEDRVKYYLEDITNGTIKGPVALSELEVKDINKKEYYLYTNSFDLTTANLSKTHEYKLKVWFSSLSETVEGSGSGTTQTTEISPGSISFRINIEAT